MRLTSKIQKAINKAAVLHSKQKRKANNLPFIVHPYSTTFILVNYTNDEDIIVASLLHDTIEDAKGYTFDDIKKEFGKTVMQIVKNVSEKKGSNGNKENNKKTWQARKEKYLARLEYSDSKTMMVICADKIHSLKSMVGIYKKQREKCWEKFNAPPDKQLWFYGKILDNLKKNLNNDIVKELEKSYYEAKSLFNKK